MFGSKFFQQLTGHWEVVGYLTTDELPIVASGPTMGKGTWLSERASSGKAQLATGIGIGFTTQDVSYDGQTGLSAFHDRTIGKMDNPIKVGQAVTLRKPTVGAEIESEGLGVAAIGNLVITSGTGAIATNTTYLTELSFFYGGIRKAQTGDLVCGHLLDANLTPAVANNIRIRWVKCANYPKA